MSLINFKLEFLDRLLVFLWRQWSQMGVPGDKGVADDWILDPEALLPFSLQIARYEPRLFDEILFWLVTHGEKLDATRFKSIVKQYGPNEVRVVGATLLFLIRHGNKRKWGKLQAYCAQLWKNLPQSADLEALFKRKQDSVPYPLVGRDEKVDQDFLLFYLDRPALSAIRAAGDVPINTRANLRFLLRSLFGIGSRAECLSYLLTHEGGQQPRDVAQASGLFWLGIQQTLKEMSQSGLVLTRMRGKRVDYWVSHARWWTFLSYEDEPAAPRRGLAWNAIMPALYHFWVTLDDLARTPVSDYMTLSRLRDGLEEMAKEFPRAGLDVPPLPAGPLTLELTEQTLWKYVESIFNPQAK